jgi:hypothetical protein
MENNLTRYLKDMVSRKNKEITFNYDEVVEIMSNTLNNLAESISFNDCIELGNYTLRMDYDNYVHIEDAEFIADDLLNEIGSGFKNNLDDLKDYKIEQN